MYPILLNITHWQTVIIGGGQVATRKAKDLIAQAAQVSLISPTFTPDLQTWASEGQITLYPEAYSRQRLQQLSPRLVIAATPHPDLNQHITQDAQALGALVNCVDHPASSDFSNLLTRQTENITLGVSTGSPLLSKYLLDRLQIPPELITLAAWFAQLRPELPQRMPTPEQRRAFWQKLLDSPILDHLKNGDDESARHLVQQYLSEG